MQFESVNTKKEERQLLGLSFFFIIILKWNVILSSKKLNLRLE